MRLKSHECDLNPPVIQDPRCRFVVRRLVRSCAGPGSWVSTVKAWHALRRTPKFHSPGMGPADVVNLCRISLQLTMLGHSSNRLPMSADESGGLRRSSSRKIAFKCARPVSVTRVVGLWALSIPSGRLASTFKPAMSRGETTTTANRRR
jgi:hypothetical protein